MTFVASPKLSGFFYEIGLSLMQPRSYDFYKGDCKGIVKDRSGEHFLSQEVDRGIFCIS